MLLAPLDLDRCLNSFGRLGSRPLTEQQVEADQGECEADVPLDY